LRRWLPKSTRGWALIAAFLTLPALTVGGALAWLFAQPWLTAEGLLLYVTDRLYAGLAMWAGNATDVVLDTSVVRWLSGTVESFVTAMGVGGQGAAAALFGTLLIVSGWILYTNLFRPQTRGSHHASYSF
jgi:hypothetical protein